MASFRGGKKETQQQTKNCFSFVSKTVYPGQAVFLVKTENIYEVFEIKFSLNLTFVNFSV